MRNKNRIEPFMNELAKIWKENCPDWRFGQLMMNVLNGFEKDPWNTEEEEMIKKFREYFNK